MKSLVTFIMLFLAVANSYSQGGWIQRNIGTGNLVSINFINITTGFMFRSDKFLLKSTNSGDNWNETFINTGNPNNPAVENGMFLNNNVGICLLGTSGVFTTTNEGVSWSLAILPHNGMLFLNKVVMTSETTGFACGTDADIDLPVDGVVYKTSNSGINWSASYPGGFDYHDVKFINENTGFACWGSLTKSTNGGVNWNYVSGAFRAMYEFSQFFNDTFYIACDSGYVLKTINNGINWMVQTTETHYDFNDIFFLNNQNGYVVGDSGFVFITTNGGMNWVKQNSGTTRKLNEVWFLNKDTGFIAGDSGLLLVTYNGGVTSLSQNYQSIPEKFYLYQNFPNPFNPSTMIRFDVVRNSKVRLSVYDISGKIISTLVDQELTPGSFEYSFSADYLPSGIYFYKLETNNFTETKRMVLVK